MSASAAASGSGSGSGSARKAGKERARRGKGGARQQLPAIAHAESALEAQAASIAASTRVPTSFQQDLPPAADTSARPPKSFSQIPNKKLRAQVSRSFLQNKRANAHAQLADTYINVAKPGEDAGLIETEDALERTARITQSQITDSVGIDSASKSFSLDLSGGPGGVGLGPYRCDYTRNGRHLLIGGQKGHVASFDWQTGRLAAEIQLGETVRDVRWLHNQDFFAVAQKKYTFIYDGRGTEIHMLKDHVEVQRMEFLPYHFLLATVGTAGYLKYQDTSTGMLVSQHRTGLGACSTMAQNPLTAVLHLGHSNGTVTLWTPNLATPALRLLAHRGPVTGVSINTRDGGRQLATSSLDGGIKVWDVRMLGKGPVREWISRKPATDIQFSQRGLLGVAWGASHVNVYNLSSSSSSASVSSSSSSYQPGPYLTHNIPHASPLSLRFCPFEDVLGVGHAQGFTSLLVPGAGEPNFDSTEADPFERKNAKREREVHALLDKVPADMITLDPAVIGSLDTRASRADVLPAAADPESGIVKPADGRPYAALSRVERLALEGKGALDGGVDGFGEVGPSSSSAHAAAGMEEDERDSDADEMDLEADLLERQGAQAAVPGGKKAIKERRKARGKDSSLKKYLRRKRVNVIDPRTIELKEKVAKARHAKERAAAGLPAEADEDRPVGALDLFTMKRQRRRA
ncbi:putative U3 small nucleolar RNA-associated protein 7 [Tilletia horrida]|nr:putative U3 small nucleolar RNA-associated protein 7 [Tilletia horrida]